MDLAYSAEYEAFRTEVRSFLEASWPPRGADAEGSQRDRMIRFRRKAIDAGYLGRAYPKRYGGSEQPADVLRASIISEEFARARAPMDRAGIISPTILTHGQEWQKEKFIGPTLTGEIIWCQGYSEPGSGSDLASVKTRGEIVGDEWVVNGQKIWTSGAHGADYIFALVRTEPDAPKHAGISYLLLDMKQPGIEVRPLKQMHGASGFNEVFFTDARTPADWIVGKRGEGWQVSRTTLQHERGGVGRTRQGSQVDALVRLAQRATRNGRPAIEDPDIRQRIAEIEGYARSNEYANLIMLTRAAKSQSPGLVGLMNKIMGTDLGHKVAKLSLDLLGDEALLESPPVGERPDDRLDQSRWITTYMGSVGRAILAGTSNIQRNVIGERGLGLPRDSYAQSSK